jgi:hypothetical protein
MTAPSKKYRECYDPSRYLPKDEDRLISLYRAIFNRTDAYTFNLDESPEATYARFDLAVSDKEYLSRVDPHLRLYAIYSIFAIIEQSNLKRDILADFYYIAYDFFHWYLMKELCLVNKDEEVHEGIKLRLSSITDIVGREVVAYIQGDDAMNHKLSNFHSLLLKFVGDNYSHLFSSRKRKRARESSQDSSSEEDEPIPVDDRDHCGEGEEEQWKGSLVKGFSAIEMKEMARVVKSLHHVRSTNETILMRPYSRPVTKIITDRSLLLTLKYLTLRDLTFPRKYADYIINHIKNNIWPSRERIHESKSIPRPTISQTEKEEKPIKKKKENPVAKKPKSSGKKDREEKKGNKSQAKEKIQEVSVKSSSRSSSSSSSSSVRTADGISKTDKKSSVIIQTSKRSSNRKRFPKRNEETNNDVDRFRTLGQSEETKEEEIVVISDDNEASEGSYTPWRDPEAVSNKDLDGLIKVLMQRKLPPLPPSLEPFNPKHLVRPLDLVKETIGISGVPIQHQEIEKEAGTKIVGTDEKDEMVDIGSPEHRSEMAPNSPPRDVETTPFPCASPPPPPLPPPTQQPPVLRPQPPPLPTSVYPAMKPPPTSPYLALKAPKAKVLDQEKKLRLLMLESDLSLSQLTNFRNNCGVWGDIEYQLQLNFAMVYRSLKTNIEVVS